MPDEIEQEGRSEDLQEDYAHDAEYILYEYYWEIVAQIIEVLKEKEMTQADLAERMGVSESLISQILNAEYGNFELKTLAKIEVALDDKEWNISLDDKFVEHEDTPQPEDDSRDTSSNSVIDPDFQKGDDQSDHATVKIS